MIELELIAVRMELPSNTPVVVLRELAGRHRTLAIFIGGPEATAIAFAMEDVETPRPLTHDLFCDVMDELGAQIDRVVLTKLVDTTYFAELHVRSDEGEAVVISARPSDAVALAVRVGCPIQATEELMEDASFVEETEDLDDEPEPDAVVEEFRQFIDSISPEDFES